MAWPFTVSAPNFDSGFTPVPVTTTLVPDVDSVSTGLYLMCITVRNPTGGDITFTVTDGGGTVLFPTVVVPAGAVLPPFEVPFEPITGLKWYASEVGLIAHAWGYTA